MHMPENSFEGKLFWKLVIFLSWGKTSFSNFSLHDLVRINIYLFIGFILVNTNNYKTFYNIFLITISSAVISSSPLLFHFHMEYPIRELIA